MDLNQHGLSKGTDHHLDLNQIRFNTQDALGYQRREYAQDFRINKCTEQNKSYSNSPRLRNSLWLSRRHTKYDPVDLTTVRLLRTPANSSQILYASTPQNNGNTRIEELSSTRSPQSDSFFSEHPSTRGSRLCSAEIASLRHQSQRFFALRAFQRQFDPSANNFLQPGDHS